MHVFIPRIKKVSLLASSAAPGMYLQASEDCIIRFGTLPFKIFLQGQTVHKDLKGHQRFGFKLSSSRASLNVASAVVVELKFLLYRAYQLYTLT